MRLSTLTSFFALSLVSTSLAKASGAKDSAVDADGATSPINDAGVKVTDGGAETGTTFNGQRVPPMTEIEGAKIDETIGKGYWLVEFFSPYCHHCKAFAPTWQTLYEFYYTSNPLPSAKDSEDDISFNSFTRYYDFHFAKEDCVANGDACEAKKIQSFPTVILFKDGEEVKRRTGGTDMKTISNWLEERLETIKPGSRPKDGLKLPKAGDDHVQGAKPAVPAAKDKDVEKGRAQGLRQNEIAEELGVGAGARAKAISTRTKSTLKATMLPKEKPNESGRSTPLTAENFQRLVTNTHDSWFIKFYAPWCPHCQAMNAAWQAMARDMKGKLNIGEVNCDVEKRLCKDVRVKGFPTLLFFQGGQRVEYEGLRGLGDLLGFANKAVIAGQPVTDVTAAEFEALEKHEEVIFLYLYDHATTSEDFAALDRLTLSLIGHARLVKSQDPALYQRYKISTWPRLMVSRDGKPTYFTPLAPKDMRDTRKVLEWMQTVWQPIVPELTASNAKEIMSGKLVVLAILSRERSDEFVIAKRELKNAALEWIDKQTQAFQLERQELRDAKQLRIEEAEDRNDQRALRAAKSIRINMDDIERKEVQFAWVDGVFWERWVKTTFGVSVKDGERVVVNDEENRRYWDTTITGNPIVPSRTSILETLPKIVASPPKISPKSTFTPLGHFFFSLKQGFLKHPIASTLFILIALIMITIWVRGQLRRNANKQQWGTGGFLQLPLVNGKDGMNGILGNGAPQGKVD